MHGRLKVKTTEEQLKQKALEKEKKSRAFRELRDKIIDARKKGEKTKEMLITLSECLLRAPEWNLFWNYRREILEEFEYEAGLMKRELSLTESCLRENNKAYAVWYHRSWVMLHDPEADWKKELELCNQALMIDERNFHCYDYRRFVVEHGTISPEEELLFTKTRVTNNMSDYSAWHYRRSLLLNESISTDIDCELDLINNAVFTDPSDQSPWFYLRWLITRRQKDTFLREMYVSKALQAIVLIMSEPVSLESVQRYEVRVQYVGSDTLQNGDNKSIPIFSYCSAIPGSPSVVWTLSLEDIDLTKNLSFEVRSLVDSSFYWQCLLPPSSQESLIRVDTDINRMLCDNLCDDTSHDTLSHELSVVRELLELEPENKWVLIAVLSLLRVLSPIDSLAEILDKLQQLALIDPLRERFYRDAASKFKIECHLIALYQTHKRNVSLSDCALTGVYHLQWMPLMTAVDISRNRLSSLPDACHYLVCLARLNLSHNEIVTLRPLRSLRSLEDLDVSHNRIATFDDLEPVLHCRKLVKLNIKANLVSQLPNLTELVTNHPTSRLHIGSLSIVYDKNVV